MATSQTKRVLELIKRFNNGNKLCIEQLRNDTSWYNDGINDPQPMSEKSIRRDLDVIKEYFPNSFELVKGEKGCYRAITKDLYDNFIDEEMIALIVQTFNITKRTNLFKTLNIDDSFKKIFESKIEESKDIYLHITRPFESKQNDHEILKTLEKAINYKRQCTIVHKEQKGDVEREIKPYKIIFMNENFYLAVETLDDMYPFTMYRLSNIISAEMTENRFIHNNHIMKFINQIQSPFPKYTKDYQNNMIKVVVKVKAKKAKFFEAKNFLDSQKIEQKLEDGDLIISYEVTQDLEVDELVKKWIPYMQVLEPQSLKESIENDLRTYLNLV